MKYETSVPKRAILHSFIPSRKMHSFSLGNVETTSQQTTEETNIDEAKARIDAFRIESVPVLSRLTSA